MPIAERRAETTEVRTLLAGARVLGAYVDRNDNTWVFDEDRWRTHKDGQTYPNVIYDENFAQFIEMDRKMEKSMEILGGVAKTFGVDLSAVPVPEEPKNLVRVDLASDWGSAKDNPPVEGAVRVSDGRRFHWQFSVTSLDDLKKISEFNGWENLVVGFDANGVTDVTVYDDYLE